MENSEEVDRIRSVYADMKPRLDNPGDQALIRERDAALNQLLNEQLNDKLPSSRVLDLGCGHGTLLDLFHQRGVPAERLFGVDLLPDRIQKARERFPNFTFTDGNAENLEFPDQWFDVVTVFTVFSSILNREMAKNVARSIMRVLAADGVVVWYDMRYPNPWNSNVKMMTRSRIRELFPSFELQLQPLTLLPPLARRLGQFTESAYPRLASIPILRSHYLGLLRSDARFRAKLLLG
jgi:ubiquinone/menaquinone biosynthesis C-methylase UbiE